MTDQNELLWNHAIETENWVEAARLQKLAKDAGETSLDVVEVDISSTSETE